MSGNGPGTYSAYPPPKDVPTWKQFMKTKVGSLCCRSLRKLIALLVQDGLSGLTIHSKGFA